MTSMLLYVVLKILSSSRRSRRVCWRQRCRFTYGVLEQADFTESVNSYIVDLALRCRTWMSHRLLGGSAQARSERLAISSSLKKTAVQYQRTRRPVLRTKPADQAEDRRHRNRLKIEYREIPRNTVDLIWSATPDFYRSFQNCSRRE